MEDGSKKQKEIIKKIKETVYVVNLQKDTICAYSDLSKNDREKIDEQINLVKNNYTESIELSTKKGKKLLVKKEQALNPNLTSVIGVTKSISPKLGKCSFWGIPTKCVGNVLFEKDKVFINPWHVKSDQYPDDKLPLYYKLKDGHSLKLNFNEVTITTLALPIKYRFKDDSIEVPVINDDGMKDTEMREIPETFSTGVNISLFAGYTFGSTKFNRRVKVKNREIVRKHTIGGLIGTGTETLSINNTDGTDKAPKKDEEFTIGIASFGLGYVYSRNKLAIGIFYGKDFGVGSISNTWNYDNRPWIGLGLGYDIFKL